MKTSLKFRFMTVAMAIASVGFSSCGDDDEKEIELTANEKKIQAINESYVKDCITPVYKQLADATFELQSAIATLQSAKTDANVVNACNLWKSSRQYWEWSEAYLFGAADEYSIDPHIDTWPLDRTALQNLLDGAMTNVETQIANSDNLAGFHGLEYIIFREGQPRQATVITDNEMRYAVAVVADLVLNCCRLEAAWSGIANISSAKQTLLKASAFNGEADDFGERLSDKWDNRTTLSGLQQIIEGFITIVDEVGNGKIGTPYNGEDVNYIESPHAYNSIQDFEDNIQGVKFCYLGKTNAASAQSLSVSAYIREQDASTDQRIIAGLDNCISKIKAMPKPFVKNYTDAKVGEAVDALDELVQLLEYANNNLLEE
ncbi:MAG: hypothetical protein LBT35_05495 [Tannerella sp.]|nr:hypothetical protein [Tannerella sp.]